MAQLGKVPRQSARANASFLGKHEQAQVKFTSNARSRHSVCGCFHASSISHSATMATPMDLSRLQAPPASAAKPRILDDSDR